MNQPLDELYLTWLYEQIAVSTPKAYWKLARQMYTKEFVWFIPNDDNRAEDGRYLRYEFLDEKGLEDPDPDWMQLGCSMLELFIGLSRRLSFQAGGEPCDWFWVMVDNVGLRFSDRQKYPEGFVDEVLDNIIWRMYEPNGAGGLFPLNHSRRDQTQVELWYQMSDYLIERY